MKAKYQKQKQTDSSAPLSIVTMLILLALLPNHGHTARSAGQAQTSGVIAMSKKPQYAERLYGCSHFPGPENTKKSVMVFILTCYMLIQCL